MSGDKLRFDGRVALVTGAGAGLGRAYALLLADRGATVVVNDLGGSRDGSGSGGSMAADKVVAEIKQFGGKAIPDYNSVVDGDVIVKNIIDKLGRLDIVINNAGILRDKSFLKMSDEDWNVIYNVHVLGAFKITQAAWPYFRKQNYGRIIMTTSNAGIYGNFGQANYSSAKMALVGLSNTLAIEGKKYNIHCNVIVPTAASRLTEDILPPELFAELKPELIAPVTVWMCHEDCEDTGCLIESAAGYAAKYAIVRGPGAILRESIEAPVTLEAVREKWEEVKNMDEMHRYPSIEDHTAGLVSIIDRVKSGNEEIFKFNTTKEMFIVHAIAVGASLQFPSDFKYLYEGADDFSCFPTYAAIPGQMAFMMSDYTKNLPPNLELDLSSLVHGEQYLEILKPLRANTVLRNTSKLIDILDKGRNAVIIGETNTYDESGELLVRSQITGVCIGKGGFGGKKSSNFGVPTEPLPKRKPDVVFKQKTSRDQAALYRVTGDSNPLHIDPAFAAVGGFKSPIMHGLCTLGYSVHHVLLHFAKNNPLWFKAVKARFCNTINPGETIITKMWKEGNRIHFQTFCEETGKEVITGAYVDLHESTLTRSLASAPKLKSDDVFATIEERIKGNKDIIKKVNGIFVYNVTLKGETVATWTLDLKEGKVYKGLPTANAKADATLTVDDADLLEMATGKLSPQVAFMKGKLKVKGNIMLTTKLRDVMASNSKL